MLLAKMISQRIVYAFVVAAIAGISSIAIAMSLFVPFSSVQHEAMAQQNETTATTTTANQSTTPTASNNKNFTLYDTEVEGLDETYIYTLPVIVANSGDSVTVSLHNVPESGSEGSTEGGAENATEGRHSFTIDAQPYSVDIDTAGGEIGNATFTADQEGIFQYHCKYHPLTMTGQLVVLPPSLPASSSSQPAT